MKLPNNPVQTQIDTSVEQAQINSLGRIDTMLAPAATTSSQAGTVSSGGAWQPFGRVGITPVSDFYVAP